MFDISAVIVTWNSANEVTRCIDSIFCNFESRRLNIEVIVIDNNSQDDTCKLLGKIDHANFRVFKNQSNTGFTKGTNQGIAQANGKYIFLLNPDTELKKGCLEKLYEQLEKNPQYAANAPLLLNEDGSVQYSIRNFPTYWSMYCEFSLLSYIFPRTEAFGKWKMKYFDYKESSDVRQPMAAALMLRKDILDKFGNLDERYIMFFNDVDLCRRIIDNGLKIRFVSLAVAIHKKGTSIYKDRVRMIRTWNKDCISYFKKYHNNFLMINWLIVSLKFSEVFRILYHLVTGK